MVQFCVCICCYFRQWMNINDLVVNSIVTFMWEQWRAIFDLDYVKQQTLLIYLCTCVRFCPTPSLLTTLFANTITPILQNLCTCQFISIKIWCHLLEYAKKKLQCPPYTECEWLADLVWVILLVCKIAIRSCSFTLKSCMVHISYLIFQIEMHISLLIWQIVYDVQ